MPYAQPPDVHTSRNARGGERRLKKAANWKAWQAAGRALIAGYVDSYSLLTFGVYTSFMSGNTTSAGLRIGQMNLAKAGHSLLPIPFFVLGIFVGTYLIQIDRNHGLIRVSSLVSAMLAVAIAVVYFSCPGWMSIVVLSAAMGMMNTTITHVGGQRVSVGYVTGDLNSMGTHIARGITGEQVQEAEGPWDTHWRRAGLLSGIWASFFVGAVMGAAMALRIAVWALLAPILVLLLVVITHRVNPYLRRRHGEAQNEP